MIEFKTFKRKQKLTRAVSVTCDNCKKKYSVNDVISVQKFIHVKHTCGYADYSDGDRIECDLCGDCWPKILPFRLIEEGSKEF